MTLDELNQCGRAVIPEAKKNVVTDELMRIMLNQGAAEIAARTCCLPANGKITTEASTSEYNLTSNLTRYLIMDKPGVWYRPSSSDDYVQLKPRTYKWLDANRPGWRDADASDPTDYVIDGDKLVTYPAVEDAITDGLWVYYGQAPEPMTESGHYPFGHTAEIYRLKPLQLALISFWEWQATKVVNAGADAYMAKEQAYERMVAKQWTEILNRRRDLEASVASGARMAGNSGASGF